MSLNYTIFWISLNSLLTQLTHSYGCQLKAQGNNLTSTSVDSLVNSQQASLSKFDSHPYDGPINFRALFWVDRGPVIWTMQTTIAVICFVEAILMQYLTYKVNKTNTARKRWIWLLICLLYLVLFGLLFMCVYCFVSSSSSSIYFGSNTWYDKGWPNFISSPSIEYNSFVTRLESLFVFQFVVAVTLLFLKNLHIFLNFRLEFPVSEIPIYFKSNNHVYTNTNSPLCFSLIMLWCFVWNPINLHATYKLQITYAVYTITRVE